MTELMTLDTLWDWYRENLSETHAPNVKGAAAHFGTTKGAVREMLGMLETLGRVVMRSDMLYLVEDGKVLDQRARHNASANEKKSQGGRTAAAILRRRAEEKGIRYSAFAHIPSAKEEQIAQNIERIVTRAIGAGTCFREQYCRPRGTKAG